VPVRDTPAEPTIVQAANFRPSRRLALLTASALFLGVAIFAFWGAGDWLIREDPLAPADLICVLSGSMPYRAEEAAAIERQGYARDVWVSRPVAPTKELTRLGIHYVGEEDYNHEILVYEGVPEMSIRILPDAIVNTEQEIEELAREMRFEHKTKAIIVTSPEHTRRVRAIWRRTVGTQPQAIVRAARQDPFDSRHWWRNTADAFAVVHEIMGLLNVWTGFPVRPRAS
jgi:uncharacterized SAM-binding protein YcdF (DUF218 family)